MAVPSPWHVQVVRQAPRADSTCTLVERVRDIACALRIAGDAQRGVKIARGGSPLPPLRQRRSGGRRLQDALVVRANHIQVALSIHSQTARPAEVAGTLPVLAPLR